MVFFEISSQKNRQLRRRISSDHYLRISAGLLRLPVSGGVGLSQRDMLGRGAAANATDTSTFLGT